MSLLGEAVRARREQRGVDQAQLAGTLGVSQQTVSRWERGLARPRPVRVRELAEALGLDAAELQRLAGYLPERERSALAGDWQAVYERMPELTEPELLLLIDRAGEELRGRRR
ncbi:MAG: hypothetical protein JWN57_1592 [Frankiales bacterium]|nr:hypothetical protein [Frankiales bacterium]